MDFAGMYLVLRCDNNDGNIHEHGGGFRNLEGAQLHAEVIITRKDTDKVYIVKVIQQIEDITHEYYN